MKRGFLFLIFLALLVMTGFFLRAQYQPQQEKQKKQERMSDIQTRYKIQTDSNSQKSIFVPYWMIVPGQTLQTEGYDSLIYFGILATEKGIDKNDVGYKRLPVFAEIAGGKRTILTVRMTDSRVNLAVLKNKKSQEVIIQDTINLAEESGFRGVVLDFELMSVFDDKIPGEINEFVKTFSDEVRENNFTFSLAIYGDVFYRKRPYDIAFLSKHADEVMVMAYDFHKAAGEPGPNFPLNGREIYGYDFERMIDEYLVFVPQEKLTIIFGMYGYDWIVDEKKRPVRIATPLALQQIRSKYQETCATRSNCIVARDPYSQETEIDVVDDDQRYHIIWFEDEKSVEEKIKFLKKVGVTSVSYWVYGYF